MKKVCVCCKCVIFSSFLKPGFISEFDKEVTKEEAISHLLLQNKVATCTVELSELWCRGEVYREHEKRRSVVVFHFVLCSTPYEKSPRQPLEIWVLEQRRLADIRLQILIFAQFTMSSSPFSVVRITFPSLFVFLTPPSRHS